MIEQIETQGRGELTSRIKDKSKSLLGYEITQKELRLMPYIVDVMMNNQKIDPNKIDSEERLILKEWRTRNYIEGGASGLFISKEFWNVCCECVFLGYVDIDR